MIAGRETLEDGGDERLGDHVDGGLGETCADGSERRGSHDGVADEVGAENDEVHRVPSMRNQVRIVMPDLAEWSRSVVPRGRK